MSKLSFGFIFFCCFISLNAAKKMEKVPDWVLSPYRAYSDNEYIVELGTGSSQKEADNMAIEGLAAIFNRSVSSKTDSSFKYKEDLLNVNKTKSLDQHVCVATSMKDLVGVEIKERWKSKNGTFYALAVLNKSKAVAIYFDKAQNCSSSITQVLNMPSSEKGTFQEYFRYLTAYTKAVEMSLYNAYLTVLNPATTMLYEKNYSLENLKMQASTVAKNILIAIKLEGEGCDGRLKAVFENIFTSRGFTIAKTNNARYVLNVKIELGGKTELSNSRIMVRYTLTTELIDSITSKTLLPFVINDKVVHFNSEALKNQMFKVIKKKIEKDFDSLFNKLIEGVSLE